MRIRKEEEEKEEEEEEEEVVSKRGSSMSGLRVCTAQLLFPSAGDMPCLSCSSTKVTPTEPTLTQVHVHMVCQCLVGTMRGREVVQLSHNHCAVFVVQLAVRY